MTSWTAACQTSLSFTISQNLLKLTSMESVMSSNHLILCHTFFLLPSIFLASGYLPMSQLFASGGQSIGASATALSTNIQSWFLLRSTGLISLLSKGLLQVFCSTTVQKRQFLDTQSSSMTQSAKRKNDLESETTNIKYSKLFGVITTLFLHLFYITASLFISLQNFFNLL